MAVTTLSSEDAEKLVEEADVVDGDGELDVSAVARAAMHGSETACCASMEVSLVYDKEGELTGCRGRLPAQHRASLPELGAVGSRRWSGWICASLRRF